MKFDAEEWRQSLNDAAEDAFRFLEAGSVIVYIVYIWNT